MTPSDHPDDVRPGDVRPGDVRPDDVRPGDVLPGDIRPDDTRPDDADARVPLPGAPLDPGSGTPIADDELDLTPSGHTVEELSDYLDRGRRPADPSIDDSAEAQITLAAMERLRVVSASMLALDTAAQPERDERWIRVILDSISREAHAGRDIPVTYDPPTARLRITEGAVRGLLRAAGDRVGSAIIGRCRLEGDVTTPGAPITVRADVSVRFGASIPDTAEQVRDRMRAALERHTDLEIVGIDVIVHDVIIDEELS